MSIKIQSVSDLITNSSTEVFVIYDPSNKRSIKNLVNAILSIDGNHTFDDFFDIHMSIDPYRLEDLYDRTDYIQKEYSTFEDFYKYIKTLSDDELKEFSDIWDAVNFEGNPNTLYDGYRVTLKEDVEMTDQLRNVLNALNTLDGIFGYDYYENC